MGCQTCRQAEPEASFPLIETDIKNLDKQNLSPQERNEDYNNFLLILESKLPTFGSYFDSDFTSLIPPKILIKFNKILNSFNMNNFTTFFVPIIFSNPHLFKYFQSRNNISSNPTRIFWFFRFIYIYFHVFN